MNITGSGKWGCLKENDMVPENTLNPREAARRLGVGMPRIYALLWSGKLRAKKHGNRWVVPASAVEARLKVRQGQPEQA